MNYLIDTNICIYIMHNRPKSVIRQFRQLGTGQIGISVITVSELYFGVSNSRRQAENARSLEEFLNPFEIVTYDTHAAKCYGEIRAELQRKGNIIGPMDLLIAAQALSRDLILVTNNEKEFNHVPFLEVENWV